MPIPRRFLPPTSQLVAFEVAARLENFTATAKELNLTQGAVSRQISALEATLGTPLFHRERKKVKLTLAGEIYAREIRDAINRISTATLGFRANPSGGSLNLAVMPTFAARWLVPRLAAFTAANPAVMLNLQTRFGQFDFRSENIDVAIYFGTKHWPGAETEFLMDETVVPVCSPDLRDRLDLRKPSDLLTAPLLHINSRPDAWEKWFAANQIEGLKLHGMLFDQFTSISQAAANGLGIGLLPEFLVGRELASGELVKVIDLPMKNAESYHLAWPSTRTQYSPLRAFRAWLVNQTVRP